VKEDIDSLESYCRKRLAKYKVPKHILFLDELPKNTTGKILRRTLKDHVTI
jgi:long-chain acyl-CoA synthetase